MVVAYKKKERMKSIVKVGLLFLYLFLQNGICFGQDYAGILEKMYAKYIGVTEEQVKKWEEKADGLFAKGKYLKASELYGDVMMAEQTKGRIRTDIMYKHALCLEKSNFYDLAIQCYEALHLLQPYNDSLLVDIERVKVAQERYKTEYSQKEDIAIDMVNTMNSLGSLLGSLSSAINDLNIGSSYLPKETNNGNSSSEKQSVGRARGNASEIQAMQTDRKTYTSWESQLIKMNTYYENEYNDNQRKYIQRQMKSIRQKWEGRGYNMYQSIWEDWNGIKK